MYCPSCSMPVTRTLSYCNYCGARINTPNIVRVAASGDVKPGLVVSAMVTTFVFGLLAIAVLLGVMKTALGLELGQILGFAVLSFLILILLESAFVMLLFRRNRGTQEQTKTEVLAGHTTKELGEPSVQALREPLSSVTDETTRAFDPVYVNRPKE